MVIYLDTGIPSDTKNTSKAVGNNDDLTKIYDKIKKNKI